MLVYDETPDERIGTPALSWTKPSVPVQDKAVDPFFVLSSNPWQKALSLGRTKKGFFMIYAYIDGACEPINPGGTLAFGVVILNEKKEIYRVSQLVQPENPKQTSNNIAEYAAFIHALEWLKENGYQNEEIMFYSDSNLVVNQMFGAWQINKGFYVPLALRAQELLSEFPTVTGTWIPRERNSVADELSKSELIRLGIPITDRQKGKFYGR